MFLMFPVEAVKVRVLYSDPIVYVLIVTPRESEQEMLLALPPDKPRRVADIDMHLHPIAIHARSARPARAFDH